MPSTISSVTFDFWDTDDGLKPGHLRDLPKVVAIAGPNGAGKSRLLARLNRLFSPQTKQVRQQLLVRDRQLKHNELARRNVSPSDNEQLAQLREQIAQAEFQLQHLSRFESPHENIRTFLFGAEDANWTRLGNAQFGQLSQVLTTIDQVELLPV
jgi:ABC-type lipoprotein export system ATPase subunit